MFDVFIRAVRVIRMLKEVHVILNSLNTKLTLDLYSPNIKILFLSHLKERAGVLAVNKYTP
jgi:hypothetical protein